jgi:hypothetical protein
VQVTSGDFVTALGSVNSIPPSTLVGGKRWLAVQVREPGARAFSVLTPRQQLNAGASAPQAAPAASPCAHNHFGEWWGGNSGLGAGLMISSTGWFGLWGQNDSGMVGVYGKSNVGPVCTAGSVGVWGETACGNGRGGSFYNTGGGSALYAEGNGGGANLAALRVDNTKSGDGMAAYLTNNSGYANTHFQNSGGGEVLVIQGNGGRFFRAVDASWDAKFRLEGDGNAYADGGWYGGGADFAEMLPASRGLQAGDVLVIGLDGTLTRSSEPYQASVAGVYSTKPGFVGGYPIEGQAERTIPLAVVGVVPVKVSSENGAIRPGDLLVSSGTPGYAMKAGVNPPLGTVIGKAMEKLDAGIGVIKMLATLQ